MNQASRKYVEILRRSFENPSSLLSYDYGSKRKKTHPKSTGVFKDFDNNTLCLIHSIIWKICLCAGDSVHAHSPCVSVTQKYYIMSVSANLTWLGWPCLFHLTGRQWHPSKFLPFMLLCMVPVRVLTGFFKLG